MQKKTNLMIPLTEKKYKILFFKIVIGYIKNALYPINIKGMLNLFAILDACYNRKEGWDMENCLL